MRESESHPFWIPSYLVDLEGIRDETCLKLNLAVRSADASLMRVSSCPLVISDLGIRLLFSKGAGEPLGRRRFVCSRPFRSR